MDGLCPGSGRELDRDLPMADGRRTACRTTGQTTAFPYASTPSTYVTT